MISFKPFKPKEAQKSQLVKKKVHVSKCSECGMCKMVCPIYRVTRNEYKSPRSKAMLAKVSMKDEVFFDCTLCLACEQVCPSFVNLDLTTMRNQMVEAGITPPTDKEMVENFKKYGTPFGDVPKGKKPDKFYCC